MSHMSCMFILKIMQISCLQYVKYITLSVSFIKIRNFHSLALQLCQINCYSNVLFKKKNLGDKIAWPCPYNDLLYTLEFPGFLHSRPSYKGIIPSAISTWQKQYLFMCFCWSWVWGCKYTVHDLFLTTGHTANFHWITPHICMQIKMQY